MDTKAHLEISLRCALDAGLSDGEAKLFAAAATIPDKEKDAQRRKIYPDAQFHTKTNPFFDLRPAVADRQLAIAAGLARKGMRDAALLQLGAGAHALQDCIAHGGIARSVLLHRKHNPLLRRIQNDLKLRDIDDWDSTPERIKNLVVSRTTEYVRTFMRESSGKT